MIKGSALSCSLIALGAFMMSAAWSLGSHSDFDKTGLLFSAIAAALAAGFIQSFGK